MLVILKLCYIDPPYKFGIEQKILNQLSKKNWLKNNAIVIVESGKKIQLKIPNEFQLLDERIDGITKLLFLQYVKVI